METKIALVTGSSTGIGAGIVRLLVDDSYRVFAGVRREADAISLKSAYGNHVTPVILDVTHEQDIARGIASLPGRLDLLVNNAGVAYGGPFETLNIDDIRKMFDVNVFGLIALTQKALPLLRQSRGTIINIGSIAGVVPQPYFTPYGASKHALHAFSTGLKSELKPFGIKVATIAPSAVRTPIWDKGKDTLAVIRDRLSEDHLNLYRTQIDRLEPMMAEEEKRAVSVEEVTAAVRRILASGKPKAHYFVGPDAKIGSLLKKILPEKMFINLLEKRFRIESPEN